MGMQLGGRPNGNMVSEINVTPFVDVMLVLLIIFMVTAPMMTQGIDVKLPESSAPAIPSEEERLVVSITGDKKVYVNDYPVELEGLGSKLGAMYKNKQDKRGVFLRADEKIPYGYVVEVIGLVREAGIDQIGMITEPLRTQQKKPGK